MANFNNCMVNNNCIINNDCNIKNNCTVENDCIVHGLVTDNIVTSPLVVNNEKKSYSVMKFNNVSGLGGQIKIGNKGCDSTIESNKFNIDAIDNIIIKSGEGIEDTIDNINSSGNIKLLTSKEYQYLQLCGENGLIVVGSKNYGYNDPLEKIQFDYQQTKIPYPEGTIYFKIVE